MMTVVNVNDPLDAMRVIAKLEAEITSLKRENERLRYKAQQVVDGAGGGDFDKFSGFFDDYVVPHQLIDELADALTEQEPE